MNQPDGASNPLQDPKFYKFISKAVPMLEAELDAAIRRLHDISTPEFSTPAFNPKFMVEKSWVESWGWKIRGWNVLQPIRSRAFDGYELLDTELDTQIRKLHTLDATSTRTQNEGRSNQFGIYKSNEFYFLDNV